MMEYFIFGVGFTVFITYMFFLLRMINVAHKQQEKENGPNETTKEMVEKVLKDLEKFKNSTR